MLTPDTPPLTPEQRTRLIALIDGSLTDPTPDGPCGCVGMHPHQSHEAHMDDLWRRQNGRMLDAATRLGKPGKTFAENVLAHALLHQLAEEELARLAQKLVWLAREVAE
jgi:hypothetical protein